MNNAAVSAQCPNCKTITNCPGGKAYGVHFAKVIDSRPCWMSYQSIVDGTILGPTMMTSIGAVIYDHDSGDEHGSR